MNTPDRIRLLTQACQHSTFKILLGDIILDDLSVWITAELGRSNALDQFEKHGCSNLLTKAYAPETILHIVSGNTPHAAFQSLLRGLLLGSSNIIKIPSTGLPELTDWINIFPPQFKELVSLTTSLTEEHWSNANAVIAIGSDNTISAIQQKIKPHQTFIPHGHKVSMGIIHSDYKNAAALAARDASLYNQRGCLSPHAFYIDPSHSADFAQALAQEMQNFTQKHPPESLNLSEAGAISNLRETIRFSAANDKMIQLWESPHNLDWTVILDKSSALELSCLNRCIYVRPLPDQLSENSLGKESAYLSTVSLHPFSEQSAEALSTELPSAHRICPLGKMQQPSLFWHHDGFAPLLSLVKWKDIG